MRIVDSLFFDRHSNCYYLLAGVNQMRRKNCGKDFPSRLSGLWKEWFEKWLVTGMHRVSCQ